MVSPARGPGRPRTKTLEAAKKPISDMIDKTLPDFVQTVEKYLKEAKWTKEQLMAAIGVGETQLYRWGRGDSMPRKATVNRIGMVLAQRLDEIYGDELHDPFPATDLIDSMLNELLCKAGFSGSIRGISGDDCWNKISKDKLWRLGYTMVPGWAEKPTSKLKRPQGTAIKYAETIGRLLGLETEWVYLGFEEMPLAIRDRKLDGIAPIMLLLPGRLFDFRFSKNCNTTKFTLTGLMPEKLGQDVEELTDLSTRQVEIIFVEGELGNWGQNFLGDEYNNRGFPDVEKACAYMQSCSDGPRNARPIPIFLIDSITADFLISKYSSSDLMMLKKVGIPVTLDTYSAFCFHPDEKRLADAVDLSIGLIPAFE
jgi:DNA-binding XRE family transcriptional regulator